jgi:hypothetical protein
VAGGGGQVKLGDDDLAGAGDAGARLIEVSTRLESVFRAFNPSPPSKSAAASRLVQGSRSDAAGAAGSISHHSEVNISPCENRQATRGSVHSSPGLFVSARHWRYRAKATGRLMEALISEQEAYSCAN